MIIAVKWRFSLVQMFHVNKLWAKIQLKLLSLKYLQLVKFFFISIWQWRLKQEILWPLEHQKFLKKVGTVKSTNHGILFLHPTPHLYLSIFWNILIGRKLSCDYNAKSTIAGNNPIITPNFPIKGDNCYSQNNPQWPSPLFRRYWRGTKKDSHIAVMRTKASYFKIDVEVIVRLIFFWWLLTYIKLLLLRCCLFPEMWLFHIRWVWYCWKKLI